MFYKLIIASCAFCSAVAMASADIKAGDLVGTWECAGQNAINTRSITSTLKFENDGRQTYAFDIKLNIPDGIVYAKTKTDGTYDISETTLYIRRESMDILDVKGEGGIGESLRDAEYKKKFTSDMKTGAMRDRISKQEIISFTPTELVIFSTNNKITQTCTR